MRLVLHSRQARFRVWLYSTPTAGEVKSVYASGDEMTRRVKQLPLFPLPLAKHIVVINTIDLDLSTKAGIEICIKRMFEVPLDKSILLDFLVGRKRGTPHATEEHAELHRLMALLNSRLHSKRFNYLGDSFAAKLFRNSIRERSWMPKLKVEA
jgi:hypothetical protein